MLYKVSLMILNCEKQLLVESARHTFIIFPLQQQPGFRHTWRNHVAEWRRGCPAALTGPRRELALLPRRAAYFSVMEGQMIPSACWPQDRREGVNKQSGRPVLPPSLSEDRD